MKKRVVLFLVLTVLMAGMLLAWGRFGPVPHGRVVVPEDPGVKTPEVEVTAEPTPESAASPARSGGVAPVRLFAPPRGNPSAGRTWRPPGPPGAMSSPGGKVRPSSTPRASTPP